MNKFIPVTGHLKLKGIAAVKSKTRHSSSRQTVETFAPCLDVLYSEYFPPL